MEIRRTFSLRVRKKIVESFDIHNEERRRREFKIHGSC